ncbi:MAG: zinc ribbon domain-containing protein [Candidatus Omnitrophica bacterium]|nr:zinc ribbon domain-containing protein [Candidatus Omnitrophota bacterium]
MPTYEYICDHCEHEFELFQSMKDKPVKKCPSCGNLKARRLIGRGAGILFKGSGFYQTDYRSKGYREKSKEEKSGKSPSKCSPDSCPSCPHAKS